MATNTSDTGVATTRDSALGRKFLSITRIAIGWIFFWPFLDKMFALGFATGRDSETGVVDYFGPAAWINGGHITEGYLKSAAGEFGGDPAGVYGELFKGWGEFSIGAFRPLDWLFMLALGGIGIALMAGIGTKIAAWSAVGLLALMFVAHFDNTNDPIIDEHIVYALAGIGIVYTELRYQAIGLGGWWRKMPLVKKNSWLV